MKQGYKNPMVTYEEIVEALKAILECSLNNNYMDDFDYLNVKYETASAVKYTGAEEKALYKAVKSLEKTIDSANNIIRGNLERDLSVIEKAKFKIEAQYIIGQEMRKLSAQESVLNKLKKASISLEDAIKTQEIEEEVDVIENIKLSPEEVTPVTEDVDTNKIFSDFEKKVVVNFPDFFKEELALAKGVDPDEEYVDFDELFNTMELQPIKINIEKPEELNVIDDEDAIELTDEDLDILYAPSRKVEKDIEEPVIVMEEEIVPERVEEPVVKEPKITKEINKEKVLLIKKALIKAKEKGDAKLVNTLKKQLAKELGVEK